MIYHSIQDENFLFEKIEVLNISVNSKKKAQVVVKPQIDGLVYVNKKNGLNVSGFVHPETGILVVEESVKTGKRALNPHQEYLNLALEFAKDQFEKWCVDFNNQPYEEQEKCKNIRRIQGEIAEWFDVDIFKFYKDLHSKLAQLPAVKLPLYNEFIRYANDDYSVDRLVSVKLPYENPKKHLSMDTKVVDNFLNVFFEEDDKKVFSWYMGAVMSNVKLQDENISKLLFLHGPSGCGKSSLALGLGKELLNNEMIHIASDFDSYFSGNNRFATGNVSEKRLSIYNESEWGYKERQDLPHPHDLTGLNTNAIQTLISDGYIDSERKFEHRETILKSGLHMILTNHIPVIKDDNAAMRRRLIPCMMKDTSMFEKAQQLGLDGKKFRQFIKKNALAFAVYFINAFDRYESDYRRYIYDHNAYVELVEDERLQKELEESKTKDVIEKAGRNSFGEMLDALEDNGFDMSNLRVEIENNSEDVKIDGETLYINSSKLFLSSVTEHNDLLRSLLMSICGKPVKRFGKRMFEVPFKDYKKLSETLSEDEIIAFVDGYSKDIKKLDGVFDAKYLADIVEDDSDDDFIVDPSGNKIFI